jgi:hypothetical protein
MMKYLVLSVLIFLLAETGFAQADSANVIVYKDPRLGLLVRKQAQINEETTRSSRRTMPGFRIQILNSTDRNSAIDAKTKVYQLYPELKAYLLFQSPYYRIKVGNFKTRAEAETYVKSLQRNFSGSIFILKDVIEVKPENDFLD